MSHPTGENINPSGPTPDQAGQQPPAPGAHGTVDPMDDLAARIRAQAGQPTQPDQQGQPAPQPEQTPQDQTPAPDDFDTVARRQWAEAEDFDAIARRQWESAEAANRKAWEDWNNQQAWAQWNAAEHNRLSYAVDGIVRGQAKKAAEAMRRNGFHPGSQVVENGPYTTYQYDQAGRVVGQVQQNGPHPVGAWLLTSNRVEAASEKWVSSFNHGMVLTEDGRMVPYTTPQRNRKRTTQDTIKPGDLRNGTLNMRYDGRHAAGADSEMYADTGPGAQKLFMPADIVPNPDEPDPNKQLPVIGWNNVFTELIKHHTELAIQERQRQQAAQQGHYPQQGYPQQQYPHQGQQPPYQGR